MLPVVAGPQATRRQIFLYSLPMAAAAVAPWPLGLTGAIYGVAALGLSAGVRRADRSGPRQPGRPSPPAWRPKSGCSVIRCFYLFALFGALVADRWLRMTEPELEVDPQAPAGAGADHGAVIGRVRRPDVLHHHRQDRAELVSAIAQNNGRTALIMAAIVAAMLGLAFAACRSTACSARRPGSAGRRAAPRRLRARSRARSGCDSMPIQAPACRGSSSRFSEVVEIAPGARTQIFYRAENLSARATTGTAVFNVSPDLAGRYFNKIECFCFTEQTLKPQPEASTCRWSSSSIRLSIDDPDTRPRREITLSYTFYPVESDARGQLERGQD